MKHIEALTQIARGQVKSPYLEVEIDGAKQEFSGRTARVFAIGILTGFKIRDDFCTVSIKTNIKGHNPQGTDHE